MKFYCFIINIDNSILRVMIEQKYKFEKLLVLSLKK